MENAKKICIYIAALSVAAAAVLLSAFFFGRRLKIPEVTEAPVSALSPEPASDSTLGSADGDSVFRIPDGETLRLLADADAFGEHYRLHGGSPIVVLTDGIGISEDVVFPCPVTVIMLGDVSWENDGARIRIITADEGAVSVTGNEPLSRFEIDAPRCGLSFTGGDIPFLYEVAETQNVASYNGTPTASAADGDTLGGTGTAKAESVTLYADAARKTVVTDAYSEVAGNLITLYVPPTVSDADMKHLSLTVSAPGGVCSLPDSLDLSSPALVDVTDEHGEARTYRITVRRRDLGIPTVSIYTDDGGGITSKFEYVHGYMILDGKRYELNIKGRGNSSWSKFPKHPYRLKLDEKAPLCGMTADRDWVLIGSYADPSLMRYRISFDMAASMSNLHYTPHYCHVDLFLNGEYQGSYLLTEKIEDDSDRIPLGNGDDGRGVVDENGKITDLGFLIEFGWNFDSENIWSKDFFNTAYAKCMYIKAPELTYPFSPEYQYIYSYVSSAEQAIVRGAGYEEYIDVDSFVDWFIVNELANCTECSFYRSFYMYKTVGGKLCAGPVWDYDMAFGNSGDDIPGYNGWASVDFVSKELYTNWMAFLTKDEKFMSRVRARWAEVKEDLLETALAAVEDGREKLALSAEYNFRVWPEALRYSVGRAKATMLGIRTWDGQLDYIESFLQMRYAWIDKKLS